MSSEPKIELRGVCVDFSAKGRAPVRAVEGVDLVVPEGAFVSIVGPSGCGKSTLLNAISGLLPPSAGEVRVDGRPVDGIQDDVGYMFARDGLFPWRTALRNVEFGLELRRVPGRERIARDLLMKVGLAGFEHHYRNELSQGMRQRVAVARTFATDPEILLMDEPFGALDAQTRMLLQDTFLEMWESKRKTVVFVTHDLVEAIVLADTVVVFSHRPGRVKSAIDVALPRPRSALSLKFDAQFQKLYDRVWRDLKSEVRAL